MKEVSSTETSVPVCGARTAHIEPPPVADKGPLCIESTAAVIVRNLTPQWVAATMQEIPTHGRKAAFVGMIRRGTYASAGMTYTPPSVNECERCVNKSPFCCRRFLPVRIYVCKRDTADAERKKKAHRAERKREDMIMNTNMKEMNLEEMEQVNGGSAIAVAACVVGIAAAAVKVADFVYDCVKGK